MSQFIDKTLVVAGAGGQLGRGVLKNLLDRGAKKVVAVTRKPEQLSDLAARGVTVRQGDFDHPASLDSAFAGADRVLVISTDNLLVHGGRAAQHIRAIDAAERAGASHVFYTSITSPHPQPEALVARDHFLTEYRLSQLRTGWTALRHNIYTDMQLEAAQRAIASGTLVHAAGDGARSFITREDCAAAAAGALLSVSDTGVLDIGGPALVTFAEIAAILSKLTGKPIAALNISPADMLQGMIASGLPEPMARAFLAFDVDTAKGYFATTTNTAEALIGRAPTSVAEFLTQNVTALAA